MNLARLFLIPLAVLSIAATASAQQTELKTKPDVIVGGDQPKPGKNVTTRVVQGVVRDAADNPVSGAVVQLKNEKTSKVIDFITKDDGKYVFRELGLDIQYDLLAKRGDITTVVKKLSPYDTRKEVTLNFKLEPPAKQQ